MCNEKCPDIIYGTGVIKRYSRNKILFIKFYLKVLRAASRQLRMPKTIHRDITIHKIVKKAYGEGFRAFDTARIYGHSEKAIGNVLSSYNRDNYFIVTKISDMDIERNGTPNDVEGNLLDSLKYLRTNYVDAYLLHYPHGDWIEIYKQMLLMKEKGFVKHVGVCNFNDIRYFERIKQEGLEMPEYCQLELHPLNTKMDIRTYCQENNIKLMAHTSTGRMCEKIRNCKLLIELSKKYNKEIAQIIIRWHYQNGVIPVVSTCNQNHMRENLDFKDFELTREEMNEIENLNENYIMLASDCIDDPNYIFNM